MDAATPRDLDQLDSEALKALVLALREQVFSHRKQLTIQQQEILSQRDQLASRDAEIEHLKLLIAKLRRQQFGRSSEKREYQIERGHSPATVSGTRGGANHLADIASVIHKGQWAIPREPI
jgi:hypothetical protein